MTAIRLDNALRATVSLSEYQTDMFSPTGVFSLKGWSIAKDGHVAGSTTSSSDKLAQASGSSNDHPV
jgi:hypothetical protein